MKKLTLSLVCLTFLGAMAVTAAEAEWLEDFTKAKAAAAEKKVPILMNFTGSDWCGWCIKLEKEVFSQKAFQDYAAKDLVLMKIDFPHEVAQSDELKARNRKLADEFKVRGFPTIYLVDAEGKVIGRSGYKAGGPEKYVEHLKELLKK